MPTERGLQRSTPTRRAVNTSRVSWLGAACDFGLPHAVRITPVSDNLPRSCAIPRPRKGQDRAPSRGVEPVAFEANGTFGTTRPEPRGKRRDGAARRVCTVGLRHPSRKPPFGPNPRGFAGHNRRRRLLGPSPARVYGSQWPVLLGFAQKWGCPGATYPAARTARRRALLRLPLARNRAAPRKDIAERYFTHCMMEPEFAARRRAAPRRGVPAPFGAIRGSTSRESSC
jgi:hypothetical protein